MGAETPTSLSDEFEQRNEVKSTYFLMGMEGAYFTRSGGSLMGVGLGVGVSHALSPAWAVQAKISQAFSLSGGFGYLYTRISSQLVRAFGGSFQGSARSVKFRGREIVEAQGASDGRFSLGAGLEQVVFSGTRSVFPAPGFFGVLGKQMTFFGQAFELGAKGGIYFASSETLMGFQLTGAFEL